MVWDTDISRDIVVQAHGEVSATDRSYARTKIARISHRASAPILFAKVELRHSGDPARVAPAEVKGELDVDVRIYRDSYPVGVILELARTLPASLVALSTHGRTGLARVTLGSVAASLVHSAPSPVLLTRPPHLH